VPLASRRRAASIAWEIVAKRILDLAREGDTDPDHLCEATLKALGFDRSADR
jgi:hypothetical protein